MVNGFIFSADRKALRERAQEVLTRTKEESLVPIDPQEFLVDSARVVVRLLDTIDHFESANFKLAKENTELDLYLQDREEASQNIVANLVDKNTDLLAKNKALEEYASQMEQERDNALETLDLQKKELELMEVSGEYMPKPEPTEMSYQELVAYVRSLDTSLKQFRKEHNNQIDAAFKRGNENEYEIEKIKARLNKKKTVKKTTPKKTVTPTKRKK